MSGRAVLFNRNYITNNLCSGSFTSSCDVTGTVINTKRDDLPDRSARAQFI